MTDDQGGDWDAQQANAQEPSEQRAPAPGSPEADGLSSGAPAPGSPEADALARTVAPALEQGGERQLPSLGKNEPRKGVRLPIMIAVIVGVAVTYFVIQGTGAFGTGGGNFNETCSSLELGTPAFEAREALTIAASGEGMVGSANVRVVNSRMLFAFRPEGAPPNVLRGCSVQLSQDGRSVVSASVAR